MIVHFLSDFHLHCVVTWGDSEHVPLDLVEIGVALLVVKDTQVDEYQEDTEAGDFRGHLMLLCQLLLVLLASKTSKNAGVWSGALSWDGGRNTEERLLGEFVQIGPFSLISFSLSSILSHDVIIDSSDNLALFRGRSEF